MFSIEHIQVVPIYMYNQIMYYNYLTLQAMVSYSAHVHMYMQYIHFAQKVTLRTGLITST